ncbi:aminotransferase class IV [Leucobacter musarum]|uniref:aminotransferase class IV n=1 Tax=Leucobacter musarum TaxID=1930747 RepID=UPI0006A76862|nr:aminotransferase class IV [Leucobacter musarum]
MSSVPDSNGAGRHEPASEPHLLAADSFRVSTHAGEPQVRAFSAHLTRFAATATAAWLERDCTADPQRIAEALAAFISEARERIAVSGDGFPRLELWSASAEATSEASAPSLALALRPLPTLGDQVSLVSAPRGVAPMAERKGPNIARYSALARDLGGEPLLTDEAGWVLEGATTSVIWWPDRGTAHQGSVVAQAARVPSVTEATLRAAATNLSPARVTPDELRASEVWSVNALHGIRPVTHLDGTPLVSPNPERLERFRAVLDRSWEPVRATDGPR